MYQFRYSRCLIEALLWSRTSRAGPFAKLCDREFSMQRSRIPSRHAFECTLITDARDRYQLLTDSLASIRDLPANETVKRVKRRAEGDTQ